MAIVTSDLKILPKDKTVVFYSPVEGEEILVRTGIVEDKCNFLHAILYSYSSDYVNMDEKERRRFVKRLRASMAGIIDKNNWKKNALLCHALFSDIVETVMEDIYANLEGGAEPENENSNSVVKEVIEPKRNIYSVLVKFLPGKNILKNILPNIIENTRELSIKPFCRVVTDNLVDLLITHPTITKAEKEKVEYLVKKLKLLLKKVYSVSEEYAFQKYLKELEKQSEFVDDFCMEFATEKFDRNIFFINRARLPENKFEKYNSYNRKSIIVLKIDENHYEIVGRLLQDNYVQREFDFNDPIIKNIKTYANKKDTEEEAKNEEIVEFDTNNDEDNFYSESDTE